VVLTPVTGAKLTATTATQKITLSEANLVITSGDLVVTGTGGLEASGSASFGAGAGAKAVGFTLPAIASGITALSGDAITVKTVSVAAALTIPVGKTLTVVADGVLTETNVLTVNGTLEIVGNGSVVLGAAAHSVVLNAGGKLDVKAATGKFGEASQTDTKVTVAASSASTTPTKALVVKAGTVWTVTTDNEGTNISSEGKIRLGTLTLDFNGTSAVNADPCAASAGDAAVGSLVAGAGTVITFIGTD
jgi:hypothetical protein